MNQILTVFCAATTMLFVAGHAQADGVCDPFSSSAEVLQLEYLDRADPFSARATNVLEEALLEEHIRGSNGGAFQKHYCTVGMFDMVVRFVQPAEDDSVSAIVTQATYIWDADQDPAGWVLSDMQRHHMCARGPSTFAPLCN